MNRPRTIALWMALFGILTWMYLPSRLQSADEKKSVEKPATEDKKSSGNSLEGKPAPLIDEAPFKLDSVIPGAEQGDHFILPNFRTKNVVVLVFYPGPKGDPNTTTECLGFNTLLKQFRDNNAIVIGISGSTLNEQALFHKTNKLTFPIIGDQNKGVCKEYGVLDKDGKTVNRVTFVVDKKGIVRKVFDVKDVKKHPQEVLDYVKSMKS
jgi:thioredoxin-dependent peroxiredoxin